MKELIEHIGLDTDLANKVLQLDIDKLDRLAIKCKSSFNILSKYDDLTKLGVCLYYAEFITKKEYIERNIDLSIFYDTMRDITIWCKNNDNCGLKNYRWIQNHLKLELFRIGRLQFQMYKCNNRTIKYNLLPFDYGENLIYVHIPQGEKLTYSECVKSLINSKEFFEKHYIDYEFRFYFCESWLLYSENFMFMTPGCNILQFQSLFDITYSLPLDHQAIERIYGKREIFKKKYKEHTTLQKQAKNYMLSGNRLGIGVGIIDRMDI